MEENVFTPCPSVSSVDTQSTNIIEEGPRICPLCSSEIKFFFINLSEKVLMCENIHCDFPFGYEELQFTRIDNDNMSDILTIRSRTGQSSKLHTGSVISTSSWSEIERINKLCDEDGHSEPRPFDIPLKSFSNKERKSKSESRMKKNVEDIKGLNMKLKEITDEPRKVIKNEKWIKNLMMLQGHSNLKLLKPQELKQVKKENKELKINIDTDNSSNISSIQIQIGDQ